MTFVLISKISKDANKCVPVKHCDGITQPVCLTFLILLGTRSLTTPPQHSTRSRRRRRLRTAAAADRARRPVRVHHRPGRKNTHRSRDRHRELHRDRHRHREVRHRRRVRLRVHRDRRRRRITGSGRGLRRVVPISIRTAAYDYVFTGKDAVTVFQNRGRQLHREDQQHCDRHRGEEVLHPPSSHTSG